MVTAYHYCGGRQYDWSALDMQTSPLSVVLLECFISPFPDWTLVMSLVSLITPADQKLFWIISSFVFWGRGFAGSLVSLFGGEG